MLQKHFVVLTGFVPGCRAVHRVSQSCIENVHVYLIFYTSSSQAK